MGGNVINTKGAIHYLSEQEIHEINIILIPILKMMKEK